MGSPHPHGPRGSTSPARAVTTHLVPSRHTSSHHDTRHPVTTHVIPSRHTSSRHDTPHPCSLGVGSQHASSQRSWTSRKPLELSEMPRLREGLSDRGDAQPAGALSHPDAEGACGARQGGGTRARRQKGEEPLTWGCRASGPAEPSPAGPCHQRAAEPSSRSCPGRASPGGRRLRGRRWVTHFPLGSRSAARTCPGCTLGLDAGPCGPSSSGRRGEGSGVVLAGGLSPSRGTQSPAGPGSGSRAAGVGWPGQGSSARGSSVLHPLVSFQMPGAGASTAASARPRAPTGGGDLLQRGKALGGDRFGVRGPVWGNTRQKSTPSCGSSLP